MVGAPHGGAKTIGGKDAFEIVFDFWGRVESAHQVAAADAADAGGAPDDDGTGSGTFVLVALALLLLAGALAVVSNRCRQKAQKGPDDSIYTGQGGGAAGAPAPP